MIQAILNGVFSLVSNLVNLLLSPIDNLISTYLPGLANAFSMVGNFFTWVTDAVVWTWSWLGLNSVVTGLFIGYCTVNLNVQ